MSNFTKYTILLLSISLVFSCEKIFNPVSALPKMVYISQSGSRSNIILMDMDGKNKINLTNDRYSEIFNVDFFPDGQKIVFEYGVFVPVVVVMDLDGNIILETKDIIEDVWHVRASPDGLNIAFIKGTWHHEGIIFVMNIKNKTYTNVVPLNERYSHFDFSPDGTSILYGNLWSVDISEDIRTRVSEIPGRNHKYAYDGSKIVFKDSNNNLFNMNSDGSSIQAITSDRAIIEFDISPDGSRIAYSKATGRGFRTDINIVNIDGSNQKCLTDTLGSWQLDFSPDGKKIIFEGYHPDAFGNSDILIVDIDGKNLKNLTNNQNASDYNPHFQPVY